jgi:UDP-glucose 6-dehydrogenase
VVTKSTVPVATGDEIERILRGERPKAQMQVVSNPEFMREGAAPKDLAREVVDTTVQPKAVMFPTDAKLLNRARERLVRLARMSVSSGASPMRGSASWR